MKRLLLIDDDESNRIILSLLLEEAGFEVAVAASLTEAGVQAPEHERERGLGRSAPRLHPRGRAGFRARALDP